jgi:hypothetical protein
MNKKQILLQVYWENQKEALLLVRQALPIKEHMQVKRKRQKVLTQLFQNLLSKVLQVDKI